MSDDPLDGAVDAVVIDEAAADATPDDDLEPSPKNDPVDEPGE